VKKPFTLILGSLLLVSTKSASQESPFPERTLLEGKIEGSIILTSGTLYRNAADFGIVQVPENRSNPESRMTPLPFIRHKARKENTEPPIFILGGGPGKSNLWREMPDVFYGHHEVVNVGYRGVDGEVKLKCPEIGEALAAESPLTQASLHSLRSVMRRSFERLENQGIDLNGYTMLEVVDDIEAVRRALGYEKINLFSTSYGTQVAYLYCIKYPSAVKRNLMVGASSRAYRFDLLWRPEIVDRMIGEYAALWETAVGTSARNPDIIATMRPGISSANVERYHHRSGQGKTRRFLQSL